MVSQLATVSEVGQAVQTNQNLASLLTATSLTQAESLIGKTITSSDGSTSGQVDVGQRDRLGSGGDARQRPDRFARQRGQRAMNEGDAVDLVQSAIWMIVIGAGPAVAAAMAVGVVIALAAGADPGAGDDADLRAQDHRRLRRRKSHRSPSSAPSSRSSPKGSTPGSSRVTSRRSSWSRVPVFNSLSRFFCHFVTSSLRKSQAVRRDLALGHPRTSFRAPARARRSLPRACPAGAASRSLGGASE